MYARGRLGREMFDFKRYKEEVAAAYSRMEQCYVCTKWRCGRPPCEARRTNTREPA